MEEMEVIIDKADKARKEHDKKMKALEQAARKARSR